MITDDLAAYLQSQGQGVVNQTIFGYHRDDPSECVILNEYSSGEGFFHKANGHTSDEHSFVQVMVRGGVPNAVYAKALAIHGLLHVRKGVLNGKKYYSLQCLSRPTFIGKDDKGRHRYVFNLEVHRPEGGT
jgi:hypothetical protein